MPEKLKVGVVGLGAICTQHHLPYWRSSPICELAAVCDLNADRLAKVSKEFGVETCHTHWQDLVADPKIDIVDIAGPNEIHAPVAIAALEANKHVFCEKPMATNSVDAARMLHLSAQNGRKLQINHHFRMQRQVRELSTYDSGAYLGRTYFAHARWHRRRRVPVSPTFLSRALAAGGPMLDLGVHVIDLAMLWMGFPQPVSVSASMGTHLGRSPGLGGDWGDWNPADFEVEDFGCALYRFDNGATLFVETSWLGFHNKPEEWFVRVLGNKAGLHWPEGLVVSESQKTPTDLRLASDAEPNSEPYRKSIHQFAEAIVSGKPVPIPPEQSLVVVRMVEAAYVSARANREVPVG